jgi:hypothetical protein
VTNNGNVRLKPEFTLEFWNQDQSKIINTSTFTVNENIFPTVQKKIFYSLKHNLPIGQYWVRIKTSPCGDAGNGFITTSVLERGGVSDKGELLAIENEPWVKVGSIVPIDAVFRNFGSRVVSAKFKGTISSGEEIFKIIDTDPLDVVPGDTVKIRTYFNPVQEGQYMITGRVLYNKKLTFEKSSVLNVNPAGQAPLAQKAFGWSTIFVLVVVIIIILVVLIVRKRRKLRKGHIHSPR